MAKFSILNARVTQFGKFEGERVALALAHRNSLDGSCDSFGSVQESGFYCASYVTLPDGTNLDVWFVENLQGFVSEISETEYDEAHDAEEEEEEEEEEEAA